MPQRDPDSQRIAILAHLRSHPAGITPIEALNLFGCFRLAGRIHELRAAGWDIETVTEKHDGGTHARYVLHSATLFPDLERAA